jgi:hypothetical protein
MKGKVCKHESVVSVTVNYHTAMKSYTGHRCKLPLILNISSRCSRVVNFMLSIFYPGVRAADTEQDRRFNGLQSRFGHHIKEKNPCCYWESNPTVQSATSHFTDQTVLALYKHKFFHN